LNSVDPLTSCSKIQLYYSITSVNVDQDHTMVCGPMQLSGQQESRAITGRTARFRCKFRYVSNFTISR